MGKSRLTFGSRSLAALGAMLIISQAFQPVMLLAIWRGQTAAWLLMLMSAALTALLVWPVAAVLRSIPGATLMDLARIAFGRPGLILTALLLTSGFCFAAGLILRETSEMALSSAYPHSPQTFATVSLLLGTILVAYGDESTLVRLGRLILPILVVAVVGVLLGAVGWGQWATLSPFWGPGPLELVTQTPAVAKLFAPTAILFLLAGQVSNRKQMVRWTVAVPLLAGILLMAVKAVLGVVFPYPLGTHITYPLHAATRVLMGGRFFERLEGIWLFMWVISTIILCGAYLYSGALLIARAFRMPSHRTAILPLATVVLTIAFFPPNQADTIVLHDQVAAPFAGLILGLPLLLALVAALRRRRARHAP